MHVRRKGKPTEEDYEYIRLNSDKSSPEDIAAAIGRTADMVEKYIRENRLPKFKEVKRTTPATAKEELRSSEAWKSLKDEFTSNELKYFEEAYGKMMTQFRGDVLPSEETQIFQAIKFEILMSRNLKSRQGVRLDIEELEEKLLLLDSKSPETRRDKDVIKEKLRKYRESEVNSSAEYVKFQSSHESLMKSLKSTRDQRVKVFEDAKTSFLATIKKLEEKEKREDEMRQMELMKLATAKERLRLGRPHKYADGNMDNPILNAETVDLSPAEIIEVEAEGVRTDINSIDSHEVEVIEEE